MHWWHIVLLILICLAASALGLVWLCAYTAKKVLHPVSKRKALYLWPDEYKMPYDNVYFTTEDKVNIKGWFIPYDGAEKTIILMHGWGMNRSDILKNTYFLHDLGFNLLYFDFRALGESGGKVSSIGYLETRDVRAAIKYLKETRPESCKKIGLYGLSMGAMVAICEGASNPQISCVAAEASYYSFRRVVSRWAWVHHKVPFIFPDCKVGNDEETYINIDHHLYFPFRSLCIYRLISGNAVISPFPFSSQRHQERRRGGRGEGSLSGLYRIH